MCQVLEGVLGALGVLIQIKSPCGGRGLQWGRILHTLAEVGLLIGIESVIASFWSISPTNMIIPSTTSDTLKLIF